MAIAFPLFETVDVRADSYLEDGERDDYFDRFAEAYPISADYQAGVSRVIPIVELEPR